jgi:cyclic pyranopterin phosphate synthase
VSDRLTHLDESGAARMVDVGAKAQTARAATAEAVVRMAPATAAAMARGDTAKGDVVATARLAGIQAAKRTSELIPLAHSLSLTSVDVDLAIDEEAGAVEISATARTFGRTGVEMEALTAAAVCALTIYDMVKALERGVTIEHVRLREKSGGRSGTWRRDDDENRGERSQ